MNSEQLNSRIDAAIKILQDAKQHITDSDMSCMTANHHIHQAISVLFDGYDVFQEQQLKEYELVANSLDDLYQRERTKNKELQRRIEELELMHSEEKRILHNVIDIERNKNQRVEQ